MAKQIIYGTQARKQIKAGVDAVANAVKVTLGPKGKSVVLSQTHGSPHITNDGVTIARAIELADKAMNTGAQLIKEVADKTVNTAGDGTTTATVLAQAILEEGVKLVESGANPTAIQTGIKKGVSAIIEELKKTSVTISTKEDIRRVAYISSGDESIAQALSEIFEKIGKQGVLTVEDGQVPGINVKYVDGMVFDKGYISPYFVTNPDKQEVEIENPYILITDAKISNVKQDLLPVVEKIVQTGNKNVVIIAEDVDGEALATLILNKLKGVLNVVAVKAPAFGDRKKAMMQDIAILTGGQVITSELGRKLDSVELEDLGKAKKVIVRKDETVIVDGAGNKDAIETRVAQIITEITNTKSDYDKEKLSERLAKLSGGVAVLQVGAYSEVERKAMKDAVDDAKSAVVAALEEGIVSGGGVALLESRAVLKGLSGLEKDAQIGVDILWRALEEPARQIAENAGKDGAVAVMEKDQKGLGFGYDAKNDTYVNMIETGIIDPVKVTRMALENAASVCEVALRTGALVIDVVEEKNDYHNAGGMPDMDY